MTKEMDQFILTLADEIVGIRRQLHANPELSCQEFETSALIQKTLAKYGIPSQLLRGGVGVTALIEGSRPGPTVAYRADIDALPMQERTGLPFASQKDGCAHSCGHDIHTAVLLGTAIVLERFKQEFAGNVRLIFQSGEENGTGALAALDCGVLDEPKVQRIIALHTWPDLPAGTIGLRKGPMMASNAAVSFTITGRGGHAAHPHRAIDPVLIAAHTMVAIQSIVSRNVAPLDSAVITFGQLQAGTAANIIPNDAVAKGTVRTLLPEVDALVEKRIRALVAAQAESFGAVGTVEYVQGLPPVLNDGPTVDVLEAACKASIGEEGVRWLEQPSMGSEDFSYYLEQVPGALVRLGTHNETEHSRRPLHNSELIFDDSCILTGLRFMSCAVIALLKELQQPG